MIANDSDLATWVLDLSEAGDDCRRGLQALSEAVGP